VTEEGGDALVPNQPDVNFSEPPGE
jgi:hypothetical protein